MRRLEFTSISPGAIVFATVAVARWRSILHSLTFLFYLQIINPISLPAQTGSLLSFGPTHGMVFTITYLRLFLIDLGLGINSSPKLKKSASYLRFRSWKIVSSIHWRPNQQEIILTASPKKGKMKTKNEKIRIKLTSLQKKNRNLHQQLSEPLHRDGNEDWKHKGSQCYVIRHPSEGWVEEKVSASVSLSFFNY